jgi:hypothetical protein
MPDEKKRSVRPWALAGALAVALGLTAVLGTATEAPAQEDTTTTVVEAPGDTTETTVAPDDTTGDTGQDGRSGGPDCDRNGADDQGTTGEESSTDV